MPIGPVLADTFLVLDNDVFTHWRSDRHYVSREITYYFQRFKQLPAVASVTLFESFSGIESAIVKRQITVERSMLYHARIEQLRENCIVLPFDAPAASIAAHGFARLSKAERNKHWKDLFIAATALAHGCGVATRNRSDFELIAKNLPAGHPVLRLAIWKD